MGPSEQSRTFAFGHSVFTGRDVAALVPWRQRWTLEGFARGELLCSIALAPRESHSVCITGCTSTLLDPADIVGELKAHHHVHAAPAVDGWESLAQVYRRFSRDLRVATQRALERVRSRQVGQSADVVREFKNPSEHHALTVNCYETLARYSVVIEPLREEIKPAVAVVGSDELTTLIEELRSTISEVCPAEEQEIILPSRGILTENSPADG